MGTAHYTTCGLQKKQIRSEQLEIQAYCQRRGKVCRNSSTRLFHFVEVRFPAARASVIEKVDRITYLTKDTFEVCMDVCDSCKVRDPTECEIR